MIYAEWQVGQVVWAMLWFSFFALWVWLVISMFVDVFKSPDLSGWVKALWSLLFVVVPLIGVIAYLVLRGPAMVGRAVDKQEAEVAARARMRTP
jgi:hypothetical protein